MSSGGAPERLFASEFAFLLKRGFGLELQTNHTEETEIGSGHGGADRCLDGKTFHVLIGTKDSPLCGMGSVGGTGYATERGLYYWTPTEIATPSAAAWYPDWYLSYLHDAALLSIFQPLELENHTDRRSPCDASWNAAHPLPSGRPWCDAAGRFVPAHCEQGPARCAEVYHPDPRLMQGSAEALITTYSLPFVVVYLGAPLHRALPSFGRPFLAVGWRPGYLSPALQRIQFPTGAGCPEQPGQAPEDSRLCDVLALPRHKYVSAAFEREFPAAVLLLRRFEVPNERVEMLLRIDAAAGAAPAPALCAEYRGWLAGLEGLLGSCTHPDQPVAGGDCVCHEGRLWNGSACLPCPPHSFCTAEGAVPCGYPLAVAGPGRRRRAMGPSAAEDCLCAPGAGMVDDYRGSQVCQPCPEAVHKASWGAEACSDPCPGNSWSRPGASGEGNCTCLRGYFAARASPLVCRACPAGPASGAVCPGSAEPYASPGWVMDVGLSAAEEKELALRRCPMRASCLGRNACARGTGGLLCTVCAEGFVRGTALDPVCEACEDASLHLRLHVLWLALITLYVNYFGNVIGHGAAKDVNILSMIAKVVFHHGFITWPVAAFPWWLAWTSPVSLALGRFQLDQRCTFLALGLTSPPARALASCCCLLLYPMVSLALSYLWYRLRVRCRHHRIARQQTEVYHVNELLNMCEWLEDLHVRDRARMEDIKAEFRGYRLDVMERSRVWGIWRTVYKRSEFREAEHSWLRRERIVLRTFLRDSFGLLLEWLIVLHPLVTRDIMAALLRWQPPGGAAVVFGSAVEYLGSGHITLLVPLVAVLAVYGLGFPVLCFLRVRRLYARQELLQAVHYKRWGYLYYGFEVKAPQVYTEVVFMAQRVLMAMIVEESVTETGFTSSLDRAIALGILVVLCQRPPFEKVQYHVLDNLMGVAVLTCVVAAEVELAGGTDVTPESVAAAVRALTHYDPAAEANSFAHLLLAAQLVCVCFFNVLFWCRVLREVLRELGGMVHTTVALVESGSFDVSQRTRQGPLARWLGVQGSWLDFLRLEDLQRGCSPVAMLKRLYRCATASKDRCLALTMDCESRLSAQSRGGEYLAIREIVLHEHHHSHSALSEARRSSQGLQRQSVISQRSSSVGPSGSGLQRSESRATNASGVTAAGAGIAAKEEHDARDRSNLATALGEALETLLVIHGLETLPFCVLEFVVADALYCTQKGWKMEMRRRREVFSFVWGHSSGQVRGIEDLFEGVESSPMLSHFLRVTELRKIAAKLSTDTHTEKLLVRDLQRYIRQLRFQDAQSVEKTLKAFADAIKADVMVAHSGAERAESGAQTRLFTTQAVQTDSTVQQGTQTESILLPQEAPQEPAAAEALAAVQPPAPAPGGLLEEIATTKREAELLREEALRLREASQAERAAPGSAAPPAPAPGGGAPGAGRPAPGPAPARPAPPQAQPGGGAAQPHPEEAGESAAHPAVLPPQAHAPEGPASGTVEAMPPPAISSGRASSRGKRHWLLGKQ